jgi:hypothetical protein
MIIENIETASPQLWVCKGQVGSHICIVLCGARLKKRSHIFS